MNDPIPDDVCTLAWRAVAAAAKLIPTDHQDLVTDKRLPPLVKKRRKPSAHRTLQDDLDAKVVRLDGLFWEDGTPLL